MDVTTACRVQRAGCSVRGARCEVPRAIVALAGVVLLIVMSGGCRKSQPSSTTTTPQPADLDARIRRFAPVQIGADVSQLPPEETAALGSLVKAAQFMDGLFLEQVWAGNPSTLVQLAADRTARGQAELHY